MKVLITGGVRSGKSFHAESLVVAAPDVTYVAPGPAADPEFDPDWAARVQAHRDRRPAHWKTAETADLEANARAKLSRKGCDWIVGNDVSGEVFGSDGNAVTLFTKGGAAEAWPRQSKAEVARRLAARIADHFKA